MVQIAALARVTIELLMVLFLVVIAYKLLTRRINLMGVFHHTAGARSRGFSPARVQLLFVAAIGALTCLRGAAESATSAQSELSLIPPELLGLVGASQGYYLIDKYLNHKKAGGSN